MKAYPLFSIIIPAYNVELYIEQCVNSVLTQTFESYEIILVDDGAIDSTGKLCDELGEEDKIKVIHKENGGLSDARNVGLEHAIGDYVIFLDSDDYWADNDFLSKVSKMIIENPVDLIIFGNKRFTENGISRVYIPQISADDIYELVEYDEFNICAWDKVIKRSLLIDNKIDFRKKVFSEDMEWCSKVFLSVNTCKVLAEAPYMYRQREGSITKTISKKNIDDVKNNYDKCIQIKKLMNDKRATAFNYFLSKNFSMFMIVLTQIDKADQVEYYDFIRENKSILRYSNRNREKIIRVCLMFLGIKVTERLIGQIYSMKGN